MPWPPHAARSLRSTDVPSLSRAKTALEKDDARGALEAVLEAWRSSRLPSLAALARTITLRATRETPGLDEKLAGAAYHAAWETLAAADDVLDVSKLAPGLLREPLGMSLVSRVTQLSSRAEDPRIVDALLAMVLEPPATSQGLMGKLYGPPFTALEASRDFRLVSPLTKYLAGPPAGVSLFWPQHARRIEKLLSKLPGVTPAAEPDVETLIAGLVKSAQRLSPVVGTKASRATEPDVLAAAGTPAGRLVAADAFLEKGDPRGIAIQLGLAVEAGTATNAQAKQLRDLLAQHADKWVPAELRPVLTPKEYEFRLGFLDACEVVTTSLAQQKAVAEHAGWSTVRTLNTDELPLLTSPAFRSLEKVGGLTLETLDALGASSRPLPIKAAGPVVVNSFPPELTAAGAWPALPHLRAIELMAADQFQDLSAWTLWSWVGQLPAARQLESLTVYVDFPEAAGPWLDAFALCPVLRTFTFVDVGQARWTFTREGNAFALRHGVADSRMNKSEALVDGHHTQRVVRELARLKKLGVTRLELVDTLGSQNKSVARIAENVGKKNVLPVTFLPGAFPPSRSAYDLTNLEVKRQQRFAKAARARR